jgi:Acyl-CoA reductase (LuxC)
MNLQQRINLLVQLGSYLNANTAEWQQIKEKAAQKNAWFTGEFIDLATRNIMQAFLDEDKLTTFANTYGVVDTVREPKLVGLVMAGNIPLVGFHDWLCIFLSGHRAVVKLSSKDDVLFSHLAEKLTEFDKNTNTQTQLADRLKGCDAYIATGSNNTSRYFDYYFGKYPHIIRKNRTSVALLDGKETREELQKLADDVHLYFGLGCRNVTHLYVPAEYDFVPLLEAFKKYTYFSDHSKYKNNYDYQLALHILNNKFYMSSGATLLVENESLFSAISQVNYRTYPVQPGSDEYLDFINRLRTNEELQCIVGHGFTPFGQAQLPLLTDFADGVDTMQFLTRL